MSGGGGGGRTTVQTTNTQPWSGQIPFLEEGFNAARANFLDEQNRAGPQFYPGQTYISPTWGEQVARGRLGWAATDGAQYDGSQDVFWRARAMNNDAAASAGPGYGMQRAAAGALAQGATGLSGFGRLDAVADGSMLGRNPEFQGMVDRAVQAARPSVDAAFAATGRLGSGAHAAAFSDAAARMAGDLAYQDYGRERGFQQQAAAMLPGLDMSARSAGAGVAGNMVGQDLQALGMAPGMFAASGGLMDGTTRRALQAGALDREHGERVLTDAINRHNANENSADQRIANYLAMISGNYGSQSSQVVPVTGGSAIGGILGGGLAGAQMGGMVGGPWGAAIGGGVGALGGLLAR